MANRHVFTAADLATELDESHDRIVELAHRDVDGDLALLETRLSALPPELARRLVASRSVWRTLVLSGRNGAHALAEEYSRLLDEAALEVTAAGAAAEAEAKKPRRAKAH